MDNPDNPGATYYGRARLAGSAARPNGPRSPATEGQHEIDYREVVTREREEVIHGHLGIIE